MNIFKQKFVAADVGVLLFFSLFLFFVHDSYRDITFSKFSCFFVISTVFAVLCFVLGKIKHSIIYEVYRPFKWSDSTDRWMLLFFVAHFFAVTVSSYPYNAIVGYAGRYMGIDFVFAILFSYLFIRKNYVLKEREFYIFMSSTIVVCIVAWFQIAGFDLFHLYRGVDTDNQKIFLSTIGNIDVFSSLLSLAFPIAAGLYCLKKWRKLPRVFLLLSIFVLWSTQLLLNSDSGYLGIFCGCWIIGFCSFKSKEKILRFSCLLLLLCASMFLIHFGKAFHVLPRSLSTVTSFLTGRLVFFIALILIVLHLFVSHSNVNLNILKRVYLIASLILFVALITSIVYFSFFNRSASLGDFETFLRFNDHWGTDRGMIWKMCIRAFQQFPFKNKLFGFGEDTLFIALSTYQRDEMLSMGYFTNNAHNEYFQYLLTTGVAGLICFLGLLWSACKRLFTSSHKKALSLSIGTAIVSYAVQAFVNISQPITTPLLFILIACARCVEDGVVHSISIQKGGEMN